MVRQEFRLGGRDIRHPLFQELGNTAMKLPAAALKKRLISSIADERMLEAVSRFRRTSTPNDQRGADQSNERPPQLRLVEGGQRRNQLVGELAANKCADLRHYFGAAETVETGHERVL